LPVLFAVGLVAHEGENEEGVAAVIAGVLHPLGNAVKAGAICEVETNQAAVCVPVVPVEEEEIEEENECERRDTLTTPYREIDACQPRRQASKEIPRPRRQDGTTVLLILAAVAATAGRALTKRSQSYPAPSSPQI